MRVRRQRVTKRQLLARLPGEGTPGLSVYRPARDVPDLSAFALDDESRASLLAAAASSPTGCALFAADGAIMLVAPPFPVEADVEARFVDTAPLKTMLDKRRAYAVFLLRLGGFSAGFFRGEALIDSKTGRRFVKGRHRKGGQSSRRFERHREKQIDELFDTACEAAQEKLAPYEREIQHVFFGGDRRTLQAFRAACDYFDGFGERLMPRVLHVPGDPRQASLEAIPREVWSSDVWMYEPDVASDSAT